MRICDHMFCAVCYRPFKIQEATQMNSHDISKIIYDLKDTAFTLKEYLEKNIPEFVGDEKEIYEQIVARQEIGLCDGCQCWFELGELNEQSECEGCNTLEGE
jgi:hypothetical protein